MEGFDWFSLEPGHNFITGAKEGARLPRIPSQKSDLSERRADAREATNKHSHYLWAPAELGKFLIISLAPCSWHVRAKAIYPTQLSTEYALCQPDYNYSTVFISTTLLFLETLAKRDKSCK